MKQIPYARQDIDDSDISAVVEALRSDFLTQGPRIADFENAVASTSGASDAVAVASATAALHLGARALGLGPGDLLWTSPITFVASANCALYCGAEVDFVDIDPKTYNMSPEALAAKLAKAKKSGRLPKIVVPVHLAGQSCDMEAIHRLSREYGFSIMEDASHAIGGTYSGRPVGCCQYSDLAVFSFHPVKIITTGEGGMLLTNRKDLAARLQSLRSHGITRDPAEMKHPSHGPWYYEQTELGHHYRMTDIQAALGLSQLKRLEGFVRRRHALVASYTEQLAGLPLTLPWQDPRTHSSFHLFIIRLKLDRIQKSHRQVFEELRAAGIGVNLHYIPVPAQPYYQELGFSSDDYPEAARYYREAISLPMFPGLTDDELDSVSATLRRILA
jgi:UDP-4-amino-4,6-dideoxy-N-acetyl-beta-L-altrosamine transaminase